MTAIEQYLIDTYRAAQHGDPMPPPPGRDDVAVLRAVRAESQFRAVLAGRPATHHWRWTLARLFRPAGRC
ncbi:hypothetical protein OOK31_18475 [Streptomyces sp. NBC_00249]|uniref:hypothetical protein n=1 Tax=Streptomyces sp. NBC_00249 TaxID=2975690 RepID=UPI002255D763|nr:hypothetical protein [Streptomyces sp. NBC_00249]MCX5195851.1 hypothetical protein [Streptomyces sp. NBC_00249]